MFCSLLQRKQPIIIMVKLGQIRNCSIHKHSHAHGPFTVMTAARNAIHLQVYGRDYYCYCYYQWTTARIVRLTSQSLACNCDQKVKHLPWPMLSTAGENSAKRAILWVAMSCVLTDCHVWPMQLLAQNTAPENSADNIWRGHQLFPTKTAPIRQASSFSVLAVHPTSIARGHCSLCIQLQPSRQTMSFISTMFIYI